MSTEKATPSPREMTWDGFKAFVDAELAKRGAGGGVPVWFIDVSFPAMGHASDQPHVGLMPLGLTVSG